ncbi:MAG: PAS domain S-box protein [Gemmataceae bacterium]
MRAPTGDLAITRTDHNRTEAALRESEEKYRRIVETANEGIWTLDADARVTFVNRRMGELLGYHPEELLGRTKWEFVEEQDQPFVRGLFERRRAGISEQVDVCFIHKAGHPVWMLMAARPVLDADGRFAGSLDMFTDVTERRKAELALLEADRRKDEFLATLAHELRNPLAPIRNAVQLLRMKGPPDPEMQWARDVIERQVGQMARLLDDLLDVSRITRNKLELRKERVTLADAVQNAVETSRPLMERKRHQLTVHLPADALVLDADLARLAQVFANLLNNAAKYTDRGGQVWLTAERASGEVVVRVKDTGIGIAADHLPRVFTMFTQADAALERAEGGLGIGLSLVKGLVEMHGGTVVAHSAGPGKGSEFIVRLPLAAVGSHPAESDKGESKTLPRLPRRRILVVDDNRDAADSLAVVMRLLGHEVHVAYEGAAALAAARRLHPDVVLLDIGLPRVNGYEVARQLREEPWGEHVALVAVTGWGQETDKQRAAEVGFDHHLTKPVAPQTITQLMKTLDAESERVRR